MKRGSALLMVLWVIAVLSVMVFSFAAEARLYTGINVWVRERNRVSRLVDAGQILAEVVITGYGDVTDYSDGENEEDLDEEDRWYREKRELKNTSKCTIGPLVIDETRDKDGTLVNPSTVTIEIQLVNAGEENAININQLYKGGDTNWRLRWDIILSAAGIPEDFEVEDEEGKRVKFAEMLIASWNDWRDENDDVTGTSDGFETECGAESTWYRERYEDEKTEEEDMYFPRNGSIPDIKELAHVRGFRMYPAILTGGLVYPEEKEDPEANPRLTGIADLFGVSGSAKINVNNCTVRQLLTVPGIFDEDELEDQSEAMELAEAIITTLKVQPDYDVDETRESWPYKDWQDLVDRVGREYTGREIGSDAQNYFCYKPDDSSVFHVKIVGESLGMTREVNAECYVKEKKVRYIKWRED